MYMVFCAYCFWQNLLQCDLFTEKPKQFAIKSPHNATRLDCADSQHRKGVQCCHAANIAVSVHSKATWSDFK